MCEPGTGWGQPKVPMTLIRALGPMRPVEKAAGKHETGPNRKGPAWAGTNDGREKAGAEQKAENETKENNASSRVSTHT